MQLTPVDEDAFADRNVGYLCERFLNTDLTPHQADIAGLIAFPDEADRIAIKAATQWGKSHAVASGLGLGFLIDPSTSIAVVAPRERQSRIIRDHFAERVIHSPDLQALLDAPKNEGAARLRREANKKRLTFHGGGELEVFSAEGTAERLMGHGGYDLVVEDEAGLIPDEVERLRIPRMASKPGARRVKVGNPWAKGTHFHRACLDWHTFHIDWRIGLAEGRYTEDFLNEERRNLSPLEWQVLYEADFPDTAEDQLIPWEWVQQCIHEGDYHPDGVKGQVEGLDPAEGGRDMSVHAQGWVMEQGLLVLDWWDAWHEADTTVTVERVHRNSRGGVNAVDSTGLGKPIHDRLRQRGHRTIELKTGRSAIDKERFFNLGSQVLWNLRRLFEERRILLVNPPRRLLADLPLYRMETKSGRLHVFVEGGKSGYSPDHGDATAYCAWAGRRAGSASLPKPIRTRKPGLL